MGTKWKQNGFKKKGPTDGNLWALDFLGSPSKTRTCDRVINSHLLYQLSYRGIARCGKAI